MATKTRKKKKVDLRVLWEEVSIEGKNPPKDESVWFDNPLIAFLYAKYVKGDRYSEDLEKLFLGNTRAIYCYVYWVVNDLRQDRPEHLHNFMIAKHLENDSADREWIDIYFKKIVNDE